MYHKFNVLHLKGMFKKSGFNRVKIFFISFYRFVFQSALSVLWLHFISVPIELQNFYITQGYILKKLTV